VLNLRHRNKHPLTAKFPNRNTDPYFRCKRLELLPKNLRLRRLAAHQAPIFGLFL
jgi:hypothetical protein